MKSSIGVLIWHLADASSFPNFLNESWLSLAMTSCVDYVMTLVMLDVDNSRTSSTLPSLDIITSPLLFVTKHTRVLPLILPIKAY